MCKNEKETSHWCAETSATLKAKVIQYFVDSKHKF